MSHRILTLITLLVLGLAIAASSASAQGYVDIQPDHVTHDHEGFSVALGKGTATRLDIWKKPGEVVISTTSDVVEVMFDGAYPAALHLGTHIGPQGNWRRPDHSVLNREGSAGYWIDVEDRYLAVRYKTEAGWHYAWVRLSIDAQPTHFTLKDYAVSSVANAVVAAGREQTSGVEDGATLKGWSLIGREFTTDVDCDVQVASVTGAVVLRDQVRANASLTLSIEPGMYLVSVSRYGMRDVAKVALR